MEASAVTHATRVISAAARRHIYRLPEGVATTAADELAELVGEFARVGAFWEAAARLTGEAVDSEEGEGGEIAEARHLFDALRVAFAAALPSGAGRGRGARPTPAETRDARHAILRFARSTRPHVSALATAVCQYPAGKAVMDAARAYAAAGAEDDAAEATFAAGLATFEDAFGSAFEDVEAWIDGMAAEATPP